MRQRRLLFFWDQSVDFAPIEEPGHEFQRAAANMIKTSLYVASFSTLEFRSETSFGIHVCLSLMYLAGAEFCPFTIIKVPTSSGFVAVFPFVNPLFHQT